MNNWKPKKSVSYKVFVNGKGKTIMTEQVSFIPAITTHCSPPFVAGQQDGCWVKYIKGNRPKTQGGWELVIGMPLITML